MVKFPIVVTFSVKHDGKRRVFSVRFENQKKLETYRLFIEASYNVTSIDYKEVEK